MIELGDRIPDFSLPDQSGEARTFSDLKGKAGLVLYVYPKDNTSGCTTEAKEFRDLIQKFAKLGYAVAGLSKDSTKSHCSFVEKHDLNFPLLSDPEVTLIDALGAWVEKKRSGKVGMGIQRSTFVFDGQGNLTDIYRNVKAAGHAGRLLEDLLAD